MILTGDSALQAYGDEPDLDYMAIFYGVFALFYTLLIVPVFSYGSNLIFVHAARGEKPRFETLIRRFPKKLSSYNTG